MILLDTHAWLWWVSEPDKLTRKGNQLIHDSAKANAIFISVISTWEISLLLKKDRLRLKLPVRQWFAATERQSFVHFLPVTNEIALQSNLFHQDIHQDPADRLIMATSLIHQLPLLTKDQKISAYEDVDTVW